MPQHWRKPIVYCHTRRPLRGRETAAVEGRLSDDGTLHRSHTAVHCVSDWSRVARSITAPPQGRSQCCSVCKQPRRRRSVMLLLLLLLPVELGFTRVFGLRALDWMAALME